MIHASPAPATADSWPIVPLKEVLKLQRRWLVPDPNESYREIGVRSFGNGIFHKIPVRGSVLGNKRVLRIEPGDLVFNNVFAWEGAVAVAQDTEAGMIGSHRFVTYTVDPKRATPEFLKLFFTTPMGRELLLKASPGSAGRNKTLGLDRFIGQAIPLPSLAEQQHLVERVSTLISKVKEVRQLRTEADEAIQALCRSMMQSTLEKGVIPTPMSELVVQRVPDVTVQREESYHFAGVYCFGRGVFVGQRKSGADFKYLRLTRLRTGDLVYPKLMAWEGALAAVPAECDGLVVSTEFPVFEVNQSKVLPEVLDVHFRTPEVWPVLSGTSTGTNVRRRRLNPADFLRYRFPLPPMPIQLRIKEIWNKICGTSEIRATQLEELDAVLTAIVEHTFRCGKFDSSALRECASVAG